MNQEVKSKKPEGDYTFYIDRDWEILSATTEDFKGVDFVIWMRGAWCHSSFLDKPLPSVVQNHIPKDMLEGY